MTGTNEGKNSVSGTNESKPTNVRWADRAGLNWNVYVPWSSPGNGGTRETKNSVSGVNESKN